MENQIVWESRQEDIRRPIPKPLVFFRPQRNLNEPPRYLYNKDLFFMKNGNIKKKYIFSLHKIHAKRFLKADLEEKMNRWVRKEFKNFNQDERHTIQHCKDSWHKRVHKQNQRRVRDNLKDYFSNHRIFKVVRITTDQPHGLDFMEQIIAMRENDKPDSFSEADFKYLNKNYIEDLYYLCWNNKVNYRETKLMNSLITFFRSRMIWERVHDFQLGIKSYQIKVNLTALTLTFTGIEAHEPYFIVDKPTTCLIYLNNKDEKQSSTKELFTPFKDPEREFRSSRKYFKTLSLDESRSPDFDLFSDQEEYSEEEVAETMAETIEQYMSKTRLQETPGDLTTGDRLSPKVNMFLIPIIEMEAGFLMRNNKSDRGSLASKGVYIEQINLEDVMCRTVGVVPGVLVWVWVGGGVSVFLLKAVKKQQDAFTHLDWKQIGEVQWLSILNLEIILLSILYAACTLNVARVRVYLMPLENLVSAARPKIEDKDNFELKGQFLKEQHDNTFSGSDHEGANEHIEKVLEIVDLFHILNITIDQVMLRAFPMSLTGAASR
ncbi:hypothetical protein Tco_0439473 [Tanacetum coccineum]